MDISCGFILYDRHLNKILLGHVTNQEHWSIPKGGLENGETKWRCALRELKEESNIEYDFVKTCVIYELSPKFYTKRRKILYTYLAICNKAPKDIKCISYFTDENGQQQPEFDRLEWISIDDILYHKIKIHPKQYELIEDCISLSYIQ